MKDLVERLETEAKKRTGLPHILAEAEAKKRAEASTAPRRPPGSSSNSGPKRRPAGVVASFALGLPPPPPPFTAGTAGTVPARQRVPSSGSSRSCVTTPVRKVNGSSGAAMSAANRLPSTGSTRFFNRFLYVPRLAQIFLKTSIFCGSSSYTYQIHQTQCCGSGFGRIRNF